MNTKMAYSVTPLFHASSPKNILVEDGGTNDLGTVAGSDLFRNCLIPYVISAQAAGFRVVVGTLIFRRQLTTTEDMERVRYNNLVRSNASTYGYIVVDYDSIPQLRNPQTFGYSWDGTHPTTLGYRLMAAKLATVLNGIL
jgi:hypothetical protein